MNANSDDDGFIILEKKRIKYAVRDSKAEDKRIQKQGRAYRRYFAYEYEDTMPAPNQVLDLVRNYGYKPGHTFNHDGVQYLYITRPSIKIKHRRIAIRVPDLEKAGTSMEQVRAAYEEWFGARRWRSEMPIPTHLSEDVMTARALSNLELEAANDKKILGRDREANVQPVAHFNSEATILNEPENPDDLLGKSQAPLIGFTCDDYCEPVALRPNHLLIAGITDAGKTTAMEGFLSRMAGKKILVFLLKRGEDTFNRYLEQPGGVHLPYLKFRLDWRYISAWIEEEFEEKNRSIRPELIALTRDKPETLQELFDRVGVLSSDTDISVSERRIYLVLWGYLKEIMPKLERLPRANRLFLREGIQVMDLREHDEGVQGQVISSVCEEVVKHHQDVVLVILEAHRIIPKTVSPAKFWVRRLVKEGRIMRNFVYLDNQDLTGLDTPITKQIDTVILGRQQELNEIVRSEFNIPLDKVGKNEIMSLQLGQFFVCNKGMTKKVFAIPSWMSVDTALACAMDPTKAEQIKLLRDSRTSAHSSAGRQTRASQAASGARPAR